MIRSAAYWNQIEPEPGAFRPDELDWQIEAAQAAGKRIILCVGAVKTFGYPEAFVLGTPFEATLPGTHARPARGGPRVCWRPPRRTSPALLSVIGGTKVSSPGSWSIRQWTRWGSSIRGAWMRTSSGRGGRRCGWPTPPVLS